MLTTNYRKLLTLFFLVVNFRCNILFLQNFVIRNLVKFCYIFVCRLKVIKSSVMMSTVLISGRGVDQNFGRRVGMKDFRLTKLPVFYWKMSTFKLNYNFTRAPHLIKKRTHKRSGVLISIFIWVCYPQPRMIALILESTK